MKSWKKYPKGNPDTDRGLLEAWLTEDLETAGLPARVQLEYAPFEDQAPAWGIGKSLLSAVTGEGQAWGVHSYFTQIAGAPWPMELVIVTTDKGHIASMTYGVTSPRTFPHQITFVKEKYVMSGKFEGDSAGPLNKNKPLVKQMRACLSASHSVLKRGAFGLWTRALGTEMFLDPAYYQVTPRESGADIIVYTQVFTPRDLSMLTLGWIPIYKGQWSLGVAQVIEGVKLLEGLAV